LIIAVAQCTYIKQGGREPSNRLNLEKTVKNCLNLGSVCTMGDYYRTKGRIFIAMPLSITVSYRLCPSAVFTIIQTMRTIATLSRFSA